MGGPPQRCWYEINNAYWVLGDEAKRRLDEHVARFAKLTEKLAPLPRSQEAFATVERRDCVFMGALCWAVKNELPALYRERPVDFQVMRYEELVTEPRQRIAAMLDYVGAEWHDNVLMHHRLHAGTSIGETANARPIDRRSLGKGRENLSEEEQALVKAVCGTTARRWDYALD